MESRAVVRVAEPEDLDGLAVLKEEWASLPTPVTSAEHADFVGSLGRWMQERSTSLVCYVAELEGELIGMAWLVVFDRVPNIHDALRRTGDIQSVFVRSRHRGRGVGGQLIAGLIAAADEMNIPRVTVSANSRAAPLYEAHGFVATPTLLERRAR